MNKALDPKDLVNPFVVPSPLSLLDVFNSIRETELPTARKRDLLSALRRVQRFTGTPLALIPADLAQLRDRLARVQPAHHGVSAKTWANIRSSLFTAIVISGVTPVLRTARMQYSSAWCALLTSSDKRTHYGLTRFAKFCSSNGIEPQAVDDEAVEAFRRALHNSSLHPKTKTIARDTATLWNRLCARSPHLTLTPVSVPNHRKPSTRVSWSELPESFQADVERHLAWAGGSDLFAADARVRALAPRTQRLRREQIQTAVTALVNSGWKRQHLTCLADLVQVDAFKAILLHRHDARVGSSTPWGRLFAAARTASFEPSRIQSRRRSTTKGRITLPYSDCLKSPPPSSTPETPSYHRHRHAAAAIIIKTTQDYELARRVLGHKSLQTTTKFYLGLESAHATERFGDIIRAQLSAESLEGVASW